MGLWKTLRRRWENLGVERRLDLRCPTEFHGNRKGGWILCPDPLTRSSIVYSVGVGTNATFDRSVLARFGCCVYAFDPTPAAVEYVERQDWPAGFHFHPWGIADRDGEARFSPSRDSREPSHTLLARPETADRAVSAPVLRLSSLMERLGHNQVDVLKMDVEGAEYGVIADLVQQRLAVGQLLVEFHHRFPGLRRSDTNQTIRVLRESGYRLFAVSESGREYSFLRKNRVDSPGTIE